MARISHAVSHRFLYYVSPCAFLRTIVQKQLLFHGALCANMCVEVFQCGKDMNPTREELEAAAAMFEQKYGGTENTGKAIFTTGEQVVSLTATPREMDYNSSFIQFRDAILALHGVPGIAAGISDGGSYAAFYASLKQFICLTVQPILDLLAEDDTEHLAPQFGKNLTVEIEATHIDDPDLLEKRLATDILAKIIKVDELRAIRGLPPLGPEQGGEQLINQGDSKYQQTEKTDKLDDDAGAPSLQKGRVSKNNLKPVNIF